MHKKGAPMLTRLVASLLIAAAAGSAAAEDTSSSVIAVYDSRAVAVAYAGSAFHQKELAALKSALAEAKTSGNAARIKAAEAAFPESQDRIHRQGFGSAPVDDILKQIPNETAEIQKSVSAVALLSKWDEAGIARYPGSAQIDVTDKLIDAFQPNEKQRRFATDIQKKPPLSKEVLDSELPKEGRR